MTRPRLFALYLILIFLFAGCSAPRPVRTESFVMNTFLTQTIYGSEEAAAANEALARGLEAKLSRTLPGSEVSRLTETAGEETALSAETRELLALALAAQENTGGAYSPFLGKLRDLWGFGSEEPHVPDADALAAAAADAAEARLDFTETGAVLTGGDVDLGGAAKGYALDLMRANLEQSGVDAALIDFGGALLVRGAKPGGPWRIGVRDPLTAQGGSIAEFDAADVCIETSGISEQSFTEDGTTYHHLLDPATGWPADNALASVTVVSESGTEADICATALFVMGLEQGLAFADEQSLQALFITREREIIPSAAFSYTLELTDDSFSLTYP